MSWKSLYRVALWVLIGSVATNAVVDIFALFSRELDDLEVRTLGTTLFVAAAALLVMANSAVIEEKPRGYYYLSIIGLVTALVALPIFLTALWVDADKFWWDGTAGTLWNIGASLGVASLVTGALYAADTLETTVQIPVQGAHRDGACFGSRVTHRDHDLDWDGRRLGQ